MKLALLGDIAFIGKYDLSVNSSAKERLTVLADKLAEYDYVVGNLETPLTSAVRSMVCKSMHLRTAPDNIELVKYLNIDCVSLANNHMYDFGYGGLNETIKSLESSNIEWFGANDKCLIKEIDGEKLSLSGFVCYSTNGSGYKYGDGKGVNTLTMENIIRQISSDKSNGAISMMSFHWGDEHTNYPKYEHVKLAKKLCSENNIIIHGHHPHVIQGVQKINDSLVAYSLGNFIFDDCVSLNGKFKLKQNENNKKSFILEVTIENNKIADFKTIGFRETEDNFEFFNINDEIDEISTKLSNIDNLDEYNAARHKQISAVMQQKFGKHDIHWLLSRLNYYSIGAKLNSYFLRKKYNAESSKFLGK